MLTNIGTDNLGIDQCPYCNVSIFLPVTGAAKCDNCGRKVVTKDGQINPEWTQVRHCGNIVINKPKHFDCKSNLSPAFFTQAAGRGIRINSDELVNLSQVLQWLFRFPDMQFRRKSWQNKKQYIHLHFGYLELVTECKDKVTEISNYVICAIDYNANDWKVYQCETT